ncbi:MAG TPA: hypothetical protein VF549_10915 [Solirubrobacteraceae bacterium]|jgi:hypothetical protein
MGTKWSPAAPVTLATPSPPNAGSSAPAVVRRATVGRLVWSTASSEYPARTTRPSGSTSVPTSDSPAPPRSTTSRPSPEKPVDGSPAAVKRATQVSNWPENPMVQGAATVARPVGSTASSGPPNV